MPGPLAGIRVVEFGVWIAGPAASGILGDWGADVVKIEPVTGDPSRLFQRMLSLTKSDNPIFELDNRNKRGIALDVAAPEGLEIALELVRSADVFITNVRADAVARLGLDYDAVRAVNPSIIYGMITGYGLDGPEANRPGFDIAAFWARTGLA